MRKVRKMQRATAKLWNRLRGILSTNTRGPSFAKPQIGQLRLEALEERSLLSAGPYPPAAGQPGSTAVHMDDTAFVGWATECDALVRGPVDINNPHSTPFASSGFDLDAVGIINTAAVTIEDVGADLPVESYWNGSDRSGGFTSDGVHFSNNYNATWDSWDGWAYSNTTDTTSPGYTNQYSAYPGSGAATSATYAVAYANAWAAPPSVSLPDHSRLGFGSIQVTNTTYAALSMLEGDDFTRRFGYLDSNDDGDFDDPGDYSGNYPDWFMLTIAGKDAADASLGEIDVYLADYRFADSGEDYVLDDWISVDLTPLGGAQTLEFSLSSSDVGDWGMNTPAYFAADNITLDNPRVCNFEDVGATLAAESHYHGGADGDYVFESGELTFDHHVGWSGSYWDQWTYSNHTDIITPGYTNQFSAFLTAPNPANAYGIAYGGMSGGMAGNAVTLNAPVGLSFESIDVTNTTYAALSMLDGDDFARPFGWLDANEDGDFDDPGDYTGDYPDWFLLTVEGHQGIDGTGDSIGTVDFHLADYRFADDAQDYVIDDWTTIDLTSLKDARSLAFTLTSSNVGVWGMNTPGYVATDNLVTYDPNVSDFHDVGRILDNEDYGPDAATGVENSLPIRETFTSGPVDYPYSRTIGDPWYGDFWEGWAYSNVTDTTTPGLDNQVSAYVASPLSGNTYGIAYDSSSYMGPTYRVSLELAEGHDGYAFESIDITNDTYPALSMLQGDAFARKFGYLDANDDGDFDDPGDYDGNYPDWFLLTIDGVDDGNNSVGTAEFYLADYRFEDNSLDYVIDEWTTLDLTSLTGATSLQFSLSSSDVGAWGMNTPSYFAADNVVVSQPQVVTLDASGDSDVIAFATNATQHVVTINGTPHTFDRARRTDFLLDGLDGADQMTIFGTDGNEDVTLQPGSADVAGPGYTISAVNFETIHVDAGTGDNDRVTLNGSAASNRMISYPGYTTLADSPRSYSFRAEGFDKVTANAPETGRDYAFLYDSPQDDLLDADPAQVVFTRSVATAEETVTTAGGFQRVYVYSTQGGTDTAELGGSETTRNRSYGYADYSILTEARRSFYFYARGFDDVTADSPSSVSTYAYLYDSPGIDTFEASPASATMNREVPWSDTTATGFKRVYAYSSRGGNDTATLTGSPPGGNQYRGYPSYSTLTDAARSFYHYARGFSTVTAVGSLADTSTDRAFLYDSSGNDTFDEAFLEGGKYQGGSLTDTAGTYLNLVKYFDLVYARSSDTGTTDTIAVDDEDLLAYDLIRSETWL